MGLKEMRKSRKIALKHLFHVIKDDTQSVTGYNLIRILLMVNKNCVDELVALDANDIV